MGNEESVSVAPEQEHPQPSRSSSTGSGHIGRGRHKNALYSTIYTDLSSAISDASEAIGLTHIVSEAGNIVTGGMDTVTDAVASVLFTEDEENTKAEEQANPNPEGGEVPVSVPTEEQTDYVDSISHFLSDSITSVVQGVESAVSNIDLAAVSDAATEGLNMVTDSLAKGVGDVLSFGDESDHVGEVSSEVKIPVQQPEVKIPVQQPEVKIPVQQPEVKIPAQQLEENVKQEELGGNQADPSVEIHSD
eukprot:TRINITY_DN313_c0_g1_i2.p1 TRINITY_DN313_c0_g1~~TRINITY_DN313_c0_g1_i2.p1  ORF type:complete len:248 (+),score=66.76 TRINITY_DN313_c0_g1_i2:240-983(+)